MNDDDDSKVEIRFPVTLNGFDELGELPFVIGVLGNFAGKPLEPFDSLRYRKFITIDLENFDQVLEAFRPHLSFKVENKLQNEGSELDVELSFKCLADFNLDNIVRQIEPLEQLSKNRQLNNSETIILAQIKTIIEYQDFKDLESAWRGLYYLVKNTKSNARIKIKVIHVTRKELLKDFERSVGIPATALFRWLYDNEFNVFAGEPYSVLIGNYEFDTQPQNVALLSSISKVAALSHTPFIAGVSPYMFGHESFPEMYNNRSPAKTFGRFEYQNFNEFRETDEAKYVSLCLPHFLLRNKHGEDQLDTTKFSEEINQISQHLWGNAAFAFGVVLARAFAKNKWFAQIDGEEFGKLENVASAKVFGELSQTDAYVYSHQFTDLSNQSLNVITKKDSPDSAYFLSANSSRKFNALPDTQSIVKNLVDTDLKISSSLSITLAVSRFFHNLMKIIRCNSDGQKFSAADWQEKLNNWISQYMANSHEQCSAERPLVEAKIEVKEIESNNHKYLSAKIYIKPGYQFPQFNKINEIIFNDF